MSDSKSRSGKGGFPVWEFAYLASSVCAGAIAVKWLAQALDPHAEAKKHAALKAKQVEERFGFPLAGMTTHELIAVDNVLDPSSIDVVLDDIGGSDKILEELAQRMMGPIDHPETFSSGLLKHPKGILLYGPPGTGKTMMAKAMAKYCHAFFMAVQPSAIQSKWYGDTNKAIGGIFKLARRLSQHDRPCVIFIDEVDALLGRRKDFEHEVSISMKNEFMSLWDGIETDMNSKVIVMGATNRPHELDPAVLRRFTVALSVPLPNTAGREDIISRQLQQHCREHSLGEGAVEATLTENRPMPELDGKRPLQWVAEQTEGFSGADLHELASEAARSSVQSMTSALASLRQSAGSKRRSSSAQRGAQTFTQPPLRLSDFKAALKSYTPTQVKAAELQTQTADQSASAAFMASILSNISQASASNGHAHGHGHGHAHAADSRSSGDEDEHNDTKRQTDA